MIVVSDSALCQLKVLYERYQSSLLPDQPTTRLRLFVKGAGCSGLKYGFALDSAEPCETDTVLIPEPQALALVMDAISLYYLSQASLDFEKSLQSSAFVVRNPHVNTTCACGSSFNF